MGLKILIDREIPLLDRFSIAISISPRARNRFNQVVEAKRFEGVFLCRKVC